MVVQWGGAHVWKVGGKVFAIGFWEGKYPGITFKVSESTFELLQNAPGMRPAPYLASRGMTWLQQYDSIGLTDDELCDHLRDSYDLIVSKLPKKVRDTLQ